MDEPFRYSLSVGFPVRAHIGLRPRSGNVVGGFKAQGRTEKEWAAIVEDARQVADAGAGVDAQGGVQQLSPGAGLLFVAPGQGAGRGFTGAGRRVFCHEPVPTVGLGGVMILGKAQS